MRPRWAAAALALTLALLALGERVSASTFGAWQHLVHVLAYATLCGVYAIALLRAHWILVPLCGIAVAVGQELLQALTAQHALEWDDLIYDGLGVALGAALAWLLRKKRSVEIT